MPGPPDHLRMAQDTGDVVMIRMFMAHCNYVGTNARKRIADLFSKKGV